MSTTEGRDGTLGEVIDRRVQVYGDPVETFARIAEVWSGILGHHVNAVEVPLMMAGMKMVRAQVMPCYSDNSDDIDGYMDIFRQLVGDEMIQARTVNEFIELKWGQEQHPRLTLHRDTEGWHPPTVNHTDVEGSSFHQYEHDDEMICATNRAGEQVIVSPGFLNGETSAPYGIVGGLCPQEH